MSERKTLIYTDGHFAHMVEVREVEEGTVAVPRYRVTMDATLPISAAAREYCAKER